MDRIAKIYFANTDSQGLAKLCRFHASQALAESNKAFYTEIANVLEQQQAEIEHLKPLAELGILACNIFDETQHKTCREVGYDENCNKNCAWLGFCRKRAELRVAE